MTGDRKGRIIQLYQNNHIQHQNSWSNWRFCTFDMKSCIIKMELESKYNFRLIEIWQVNRENIGQC